MKIQKYYLCFLFYFADVRISLLLEEESSDESKSNLYPQNLQFPLFFFFVSILYTVQVYRMTMYAGCDCFCDLFLSWNGYFEAAPSLLPKHYGRCRSHNVMT